MSNRQVETGRSSARSFLVQQSVFLGFNDFQDGIWGKDYEDKKEYWQISYEWGRQIAAYCEAKQLSITWKKLNVIPRALTTATWRSVSQGYMLN
jgi:hypothetical protein